MYSFANAGVRRLSVIRHPNALLSSLVTSDINVVLVGGGAISSSI